jgi:predicted phosphodiesterase
MIALISDLHANLESLKAFLDRSKSQGVSRIYCLGDVVGYGPDPDKCIQILRKLNIPVVRGNHDHYASSEESLGAFNLEALNSLIWTRNNIKKINKQWLQSLPYSLVCNIDDFIQLFLSHSNVNELSGWPYINDVDAAEQELRKCPTQFNFIGHTHKPAIYSLNANGCVLHELIEDQEILLDMNSKWLVNVGSLGQPRDRKTSASYVVYDETNHSITLKRINYNYRKTVFKISKKGLPEKNGRRLTAGI